MKQQIPNQNQILHIKQMKPKKVMKPKSCRFSDCLRNLPHLGLPSPAPAAPAGLGRRQSRHQGVAHQQQAGSAAKQRFVERGDRGPSDLEPRGAALGDHLGPLGDQLDQ